MKRSGLSTDRSTPNTKRSGLKKAIWKTLLMLCTAAVIVYGVVAHGGGAYGTDELLMFTLALLVMLSMLGDAVASLVYYLKQKIKG